MNYLKVFSREHRTMLIFGAALVVALSMAAPARANAGLEFFFTIVGWACGQGWC